MESKREYILHNGEIPSGSGNSVCMVGDDRRILHGKRIPSGSGNSGCVVGDDGEYYTCVVGEDWRIPSGSGNSGGVVGDDGGYYTIGGLRVRVTQIVL